MKEISVEELKKLQMEILDYVDSICRANDIKYTLSGGTLLGAVRHGGYIPWDDDIDIQMTRKEYDKFTTLWNNHDNRSPYELLNIESGKNFGYPFGKVHDTRTTTYIGDFQRTGVFIDVFPVDNVSDESDFERRHSKVKKMYRIRSFVFRILKRFPKCSVIKLIFNKVSASINNEAKKLQYLECPYVFELVSGLICKSPIPSAVFKEYKDIRFEDRIYLAVDDYDAYLKCTFGNYLQLPPEEKRISHHDFKAYWRYYG